MNKSLNNLLLFFWLNALYMMITGVYSFHFENFIIKKIILNHDRMMMMMMIIYHIIVYREAIASMLLLLL